MHPNSYMAYKNKTIFNPFNKQEIQFLQTAKDTGGKLLEMQSTYQAHSTEPTPHYHPFQEEDFTVISGELSVRMDHGLHVLKAGESLHIPKNKIHSMWNQSEGVTVVNWKVQPAMNTEYFLEMATGLASDGKINKNGIPNLLQVALMANKFSAVFRLARPPYAVQKIVFLLLTPFAYIFGYKPVDKKYLD